MAVKLIADVHSYPDGLASSLAPADTLIVLGDVLGLIDWADLSGIIPETIGADRLVGELQEAGKQGPHALKALRQSLFDPNGDYYGMLEGRIRDDYRAFGRLLESAGCQAYVLYGNSDIPEALREETAAAANVTVAEGVYELEGQRFAMMPGAISSPWDMPGELPDDEFGRRLMAMGPADVVCTHVPPQVPEAVFDIVANRPQSGSKGLLEYIEKMKPRFAYHGHVHQPAQRELKVGETRVVNVAYYKRDRYLHVHGG